VSLPRGRVLRATDAGERIVLVPSHHEARAPRGRRLEREVIEANERAAAVVHAAERRASAILASADHLADESRRRAEAAGRAEGLADALSLSLRLREREARADEGDLDRIVELAKLLAERLLGHALSAAPREIIAIAREVLAEARGARRVEVRAHPLDAELLRAATFAFDESGRVHAIVSDEALARGDIRLNTDLGMIDARIGSELERLAERLREALSQ